MPHLTRYTLSTNRPTTVASSIFISEALVMLRRKQVGNPRGFFTKSFADYREGFAENGKRLNYNLYMLYNPERKLCVFLGESWIGLERLHRLTSEHSYGLEIIMTDFHGKEYLAFYKCFKVIRGTGVDALSNA